LDTPLHSLYVNSRPLDKGRNKDMIIIFGYLSVACIPIHTYKHTYTHTNTNIQMLLIPYMSGHTFN